MRIVEASAAVFNDVVDVVRAAIDLGAKSRCGGRRTSGENRLVRWAMLRPALPRAIVEDLASAIRAGEDPLGEALQRLHDRSKRRSTGMFYTPTALVEPMVTWMLEQHPELVIDPGCGSGRFAAAVARRSPGTAVLAIDKNPAATLVARAVLATLAPERWTVRHADFLTMSRDMIPRTGQMRVGWLGNPPFVRHHEVSRRAKERGLEVALETEHHSNLNAGLHLLFFAKTKTLALGGDVGCYVTSAEWLDNRTGGLVRELFLNGLGGTGVTVIEPKTFTFTAVKTTAALTQFVIGQHDTPKRIALGVPVAEVPRHLAGEGGVVIARERLEAARGWTHAARNPHAVDDHGPTIGDLFRVTRGTATGSNEFFALTPDRAKVLGVAKYGVPTVTRAEDIIAANGVLWRRPDLKIVLNIPKTLRRQDDPALDAYLKTGERSDEQGLVVSAGSNAQKRNPWWVLNVARPPIVATYMARRPPAFARNPDQLGILNIAIGLTPKVPMSEEQMRTAVDALNAAAPTYEGHAVTYFGDLKKFEPRTLASLPLPASLCAFLPATTTK
ncbi:MAG TPA: methyltransferase [Candidatus Sulfotelmatobacter sp.]|nr:methyltransferase [Candidatus Sulfotelmatobacter sp.]